MLNRKRAFTLIELLVVISIVALLISLLLPSIKQARGLARTIQCQGSLHQLLVATRAFSEENGNRLPHLDVSRSGLFPPQYLPDQSMSWLSAVVTDIMGIEMNVPSGFWCPQASSEQAFTPSWSGYYWSMASTRSYGINDWGGASTSRAVWEARLDDIKHQQTVYLYTDTNKSYPYNGNAAASWHYPSFFGARAHEPANYVDYRHAQQVNMAYVDGHAGVPELIEFPFLDAFNPYGRILPLVTKDTWETVWHTVAGGNWGGNWD